ncbi:MAG: succinylglutamate desuccinylase/aspartoacylase family protein, partial [Mesorhizobium sp.]
LLPDTTRGTVDQRLKIRLLQLSIGHDLVLDLHCDDEGLAYLYVHTSLWPAMADCAAAMGVDAVVLWDEDTDGTFEGASIMPYQNVPADVARLDRRVATTVEYRGILDVDGALAASDAEGLYRLLVARGVIVDQTLPEPGSFAGPNFFTGIVAP